VRSPRRPGCGVEQRSRGRAALLLVLAATDRRSGPGGAVVQRFAMGSRVVFDKRTLVRGARAGEIVCRVWPENGNSAVLSQPTGPATHTPCRCAAPRTCETAAQEARRRVCRGDTRPLRGRYISR
jgi:hypothetical protein